MTTRAACPVSYDIGLDSLCGDYVTDKALQGELRHMSLCDTCQADTCVTGVKGLDDRIEHLGKDSPCTCQYQK